MMYSMMHHGGGLRAPARPNAATAHGAPTSGGTAYHQDCLLSYPVCCSLSSRIPLGGAARGGVLP